MLHFVKIQFYTKFLVHKLSDYSVTPTSQVCSHHDCITNRNSECTKARWPQVAPSFKICKLIPTLRVTLILHAFIMHGFPYLQFYFSFPPSPNCPSHLPFMIQLLSNFPNQHLTPNSYLRQIHDKFR